MIVLNSEVQAVLSIKEPYEINETNSFEQFLYYSLKKFVRTAKIRPADEPISVEQGFLQFMNEHGEAMLTKFLGFGKSVGEDDDSADDGGLDLKLKDEEQERSQG